MLKQTVTAAFAGDWEKAREIHFRLFPLMETNFIESNPIPVKTALALMGRLRDNFRLPMIQATEKTREKLTEILKDLELL